jgi:hypothetical protein
MCPHFRRNLLTLYSFLAPCAQTEIRKLKAAPSVTSLPETAADEVKQAGPYPITAHGHILGRTTWRVGREMTMHANVTQRCGMVNDGP